MPRSLDPEARLTMVLACDVDKSPQPKIFAKAPTLNQQRKLIGLMGSLQGTDLQSQIDAIIDTAAACLTGWENIPFEFSRDNIGEVLSLEEMMEIFGFLVSATVPTADDKKKVRVAALVRCGELCKSCVGRCRESVSEKFPAEIECPICGSDGKDCEHCEDGWYQVTECPSKYIGQELIADMQIVSACEHHLPVAGGLLDQSAWWFELRGLLKSEEHRVQEEQAKRRE